MTNIAVIGTGHLGATHAACMAELGHDVLGVDIDYDRLSKLSAGELPFYEPGLAEILRNNLDTGKLRFTPSYQDAADFADAIFIAVGTPQQHGKLAADLSAVYTVIDTIAPLLTRPAVIFGKSTVPVGTAAYLCRRLRRLTPHPDRVHLAWNPEFLREGLAVKDTFRPDRIVIGLDEYGSGNAEAIAREIYEPLLAQRVPLLITNLPTAELIKASANAFLATKISFINSVGEICERTGADVSALADALGYDERIGRSFLSAGIGFGGGCLPKDIRGLIAIAGEIGAGQAYRLLREVDSINMAARNKIVELARQATGGSFVGARVAILGAAFKPDSDDVRDSPALNVARQIQIQGADVSVHDPKAMDNAKRLFPTLCYQNDPVTACTGADIVMVLTEWMQYISLTPSELAIVVRRKTIIDGRNCLNPAAWRNNGWLYCGIGRGESSARHTASDVDMRNT